MTVGGLTILNWPLVQIRACMVSCSGLESTFCLEVQIHLDPVQDKTVTKDEALNEYLNLF